VISQRAVWSVRGEKSRMKREFHVRFCEGAGVQFPCATRLFRLERHGHPSRLVTRIDCVSSHANPLTRTGRETSKGQPNTLKGARTVL
jgi:hypothetical protein